MAAAAGMVAVAGIPVGYRVALAKASAVGGCPEEAAIAGVARVAATGVAAIGVAVIGAIIITIDSLTEPFSSAASVFRTGGAGAIRTDITDTTTTRMTTTAMDMVVATDMITTGLVTSTAIAANQGLLSCSADSPALAIIVALLTGSWGPRRGEQFVRTSGPRDLQADRSPASLSKRMS
jgi:hypothetical protein